MRVVVLALRRKEKASAVDSAGCAHGKHTGELAAIREASGDEDGDFSWQGRSHRRKQSRQRRRIREAMSARFATCGWEYIRRVD